MSVSSWSLMQRSWAILALLVLMLSGSGLYVYREVQAGSVQQRLAASRMHDETEVGRSIAFAVHNITKLASSFKNVLLRGADEKARNKHMAEFAKHRDEFLKNTDTLQNLPSIQADAKRLELVRQWRAQFNEMASKYQAQLDVYNPEDPDIYRKLDKAVSGMDRPVVATGKQLEEQAEKELMANFEALNAERDAVAQQLGTHLLAAFALVSVVLSGCLFWYARSLVRSLGAEPVELSQFAERLAKGDLKPSAQQAWGHGSVAWSFEQMRMGLAGLVSGIRSKSDELEHSISGIQNRIEEVEKAAFQQSNAGSELATAIEELSASVDQLLMVAERTAEASSRSQASSGAGLGLVQESSTAVEQTSEGAQALSHTVQKLGEQSQGIGQIVSVIEGIAEQTNLLALNAAIEAARAGESGRGFAVVADEVRRLAERTTESTSEIESMVRAIQQGAQTAVTDMSMWAGKVSENLDRMQKAKDLMQELQNAAAEVRSLASEVSASLAEQRVVSNQMSCKVEQMAAGSEENANSVQGISAVLAELHQLASQLRGEAAKFVGA